MSSPNEGKWFQSKRATGGNLYEKYAGVGMRGKTEGRDYKESK